MRDHRGLGVPVPEPTDPVPFPSGTRASAVPTSVPDRLEGGLTLTAGGRCWALQGTRLLVGRSGGGVGADVEIDDPSLSRRHAELVASGASWVLRDLGSTNGTWVGDRRLAPGEAGDLAPEVTIRLGGVAAIIRTG